MENDAVNYSMIIKQIDVHPELERFVKESLMGLTLIQTKTGEMKWVPIDDDFRPPVNKRGVHGILMLLNGVITTVNKLAYKSENQVLNDMFYLQCVLVDHFYLNCDEWGLNDDDAPALKEAIIRLAWDIASASINGFTAVNIRSQYSMNEVTNEQRMSKNNNKKFLQTLGGKT
jgi:hypothetical protein